MRDRSEDMKAKKINRELQVMLAEKPVEISHANLEENTLYLVFNASDPDYSTDRFFVAKFSHRENESSGTGKLVFKDPFRCIKHFGTITGLMQVTTYRKARYKFNADPHAVKVYHCSAYLENMFNTHYDRRNEKFERRDMVRNDLNEAEELYEICGICGFSLDNEMGPPPDEADVELCGRTCNDVIHMCENGHISHKICALKCLNLKPVNVTAQMGYTQFTAYKPNLRSGTCPFCTLTITEQSILSQPRLDVQNAKKRKASKLNEEPSSPNRKYKRGGKRTRKRNTNERYFDR